MGYTSARHDATLFSCERAQRVQAVFSLQVRRSPPDIHGSLRNEGPAVARRFAAGVASSGGRPRRRWQPRCRIAVLRELLAACCVPAWDEAHQWHPSALVASSVQQLRLRRGLHHHHARELPCCLPNHVHDASARSQGVRTQVVFCQPCPRLVT